MGSGNVGAFGPLGGGCRAARGGRPIKRHALDAAAENAGAFGSQRRPGCGGGGGSGDGACWNWMPHRLRLKLARRLPIQLGRAAPWHSRGRPGRSATLARGVSAILVIVENHSDRPVDVRRDDFALQGASGERFTTVAPSEVP